MKSFTPKSHPLLALIITIVTAICVVTILLLGATDNHSRTIRTSASYRELRNMNVTLEGSDSFAGVVRTYTCYLPDLPIWGEDLFIYFVHEYADVWLDDELVAACDESDDWQLGQTPGCYWLKIPLREEDGGHQLKIVSRPVYHNVLDRSPQVILSEWGLILYVLIHSSVADLILGSINALAGLIFALGALIASIETSQRKQIFYLGLFTLSIGIWRLCDMPVMPLLFPSGARVLYYLTMLGIMLAPLCFTRFLVFSYSDYRASTYRILSRIMVIIVAVEITLQLLNRKDLREIVTVSITGMSIAAIPILVWSVRHLIRNREDLLENVYDCLYIFFVVAGIGDAIRFSIYRTSHYVSWLLVAVTVHLIVMITTILYDIVENIRRSYSMQTELAEERSRLMLSQIQPHFLYNCLSVIRELCHIDPLKAEEATVRFSQYLRQNMDSMLKDKPVPFAEDLQHTRNYLELEQLRFGDALKVEYDIATDDFLVPPLTLEPIVENAVRHGIRKNENGGTVRISTYQTRKQFRIKVEDDGPGFDPAALEEKLSSRRKPHPEEKSHVGLTTVRHRLKYICEGTLDINSRPGVGTVVTISIPKNNTAGERNIARLHTAGEGEKQS